VNESIQSLTTFGVGEWLFGLPSAQVREFMRQPWITQIPLLSPAVHGVFNARGELITVIDLRRRLGLPDAAGGYCDVHVILETSDGTVSLLVDRAGDVRSVASSEFQPPPAHLGEGARECVLGAYTFEQGMVLLLDSARTLSLPEDGLGEGAAQRPQESA
jgi:purine-binding chemotaxis protein CheW